MVCRRWKQLGYPVLWTNVGLINHKIKTFAHSIVEVDESICRLVRNLSIQLDPVSPKTPWDGGGGLPLFWGETLPPQGEPPLLSTFLKDTSAEWRKALRSFWELSKNMRSKLSRLKTYSYRMELEPPIILQKQRHFINPPRIPASLLGEFLRAVPSSCTSLEFDTCAIDSVDEGNEHLCPTIRGILSRLHHLRLCLNHIYPNLFDPNYQFPDSSRSVITKFMAPHLNYDNQPSAITVVWTYSSRTSRAYPYCLITHPLVCRNRSNQKPGTPRLDGQITCRSQQEESPSIHPATSDCKHDRTP